jgi:Domain of unknown function (DUF4864)
MDMITLVTRRRRLLCLSLAALLCPLAAGAVTLSEADARAVRLVIEGQLDAFAAERAYSYASNAIRTQFGDAAAFMAMVQSGYPMVVRPVTVTFFQPQPSDDGAVLQTLQLRDRGGRLWRATYQLERQPGDGWRINGVTVVPDSGKSMT